MNNKQLEQTINKLLDKKLSGVELPENKVNSPESQEGNFEYSPILSLLDDNSVEYTVEGNIYAVKGYFYKLGDGQGFKNGALISNYSGNIAVCVEFQDGKSVLSAYIDPKTPITTISPLNNKVINLKGNEFGFVFEYFKEGKSEDANS